MAVALWGNTLFLANVTQGTAQFQLANRVYWICAMVFLFNLTVRIYRSAERINRASEMM